MKEDQIQQRIALELIKNDLHYARIEVLQNWGEKKNGGNFIGMKIDFAVDKLIIIF